MIDFSEKNISRIAAETGFLKDNLEKVVRLADILEFLFSSKWKNKLVLKGGTAINLFYKRMPRLSVDIDLDYIGGSKDEMLKDKDELWAFISTELVRKEYNLSPKSKRSFALDSDYLEYRNNSGNHDKIKIDINYMDRAHILPINEKIVSYPHIEGEIAIKVLDPSELYGSKISALLGRCKPRDVFDVFSLAKDDALVDRTILRKCAIFYNCVGGEANIDALGLEILDGLKENDVFRWLRPLLSKKDRFSRLEAIAVAKDYLKNVIVLTDEEKAYVDEFRQKRYRPDLLFDDAETISRIKDHPMVAWRLR